MKKTNRCISEGLDITLKDAQCNPVAAYNVALLLESEHRAPSTAQQYIYKAACGGYTPAMVRMACFLMSGEYLQYLNQDTPVFISDARQAVCWLEKAARFNDQTAHYLLARCCAEGICYNKSLPAARSHLAWVKFHPDFGNPYEDYEILAFGSVSQTMMNLVDEMTGGHKGRHNVI